MNELTIIMYHYVRPIAEGKFPRIKGLEVKAFSRQLDFLQNNFSIISSDQVIDAVINNKVLPKNPCWLTFDDGYKDHFNYVLPELLKRNLSAAFFPPKAAIKDNKILDVNLIHHILNHSIDMNILISELREKCIKFGIKKDQIDEYYNEYGIASRFDNADTVFFKRMLQHVLPEDIRNSITSTFFDKYVGIPEDELSKKLYMNVDEIRKLISSGMYVGSHGAMHYWLNRINYQKQKEDISASLEFLEEIGAPTKNWIMCYPYGAYNDTTISVLKELGASIGITVEPRKAILGVDHSLKLPRLDTNDFPQ